MIISQEKSVSILLFICCVIPVHIKADPLCGEWVAYRDVKCFKIIESTGLVDYDDAVNTCKSQTSNNDSNLVTIASSDEQSFLTTFLFTTNKIVDNVWIGAKFTDNQYKWLNGLNLTFTNWFEGHPKNLTDNCVQMHSDPDSVGQWVDESCKRKNAVLCQKMPVWTQAHIQESVLILQETVLIQQQTIAYLKEHLIPVGFIYVQFPNEKIPQELWSWMTWQEITSSYAGLFFRAFGGNSSSFGSTQEANSPRITQFQSQLLSYHSSAGNTDASNITEGEWSKWVVTGGKDGAAYDTRFFASDAEVRPRNTAIRVWKRDA